MGSPHYETFNTEEEAMNNKHKLLNESSKLTQELSSKDKEARKLSQQHLLQLAALAVLIASILFCSIGSASVQILSGAIPEFELNAWRFGVQLIIMFPITIYRKCDIKVPRSAIWLVVLNIFFLNAINVLCYTAYIYLPLGLADGLMHALIIAGNAVLSICIKSDRKLILYIAAILSLLGLVLMIQPDVLFAGVDLPPPPVVNWTSSCIRTTNLNQTIHLEHDSAQGQLLGYVFIAMTSVIMIIHYHAVSKMVQDVNPMTFAFWNALAGTGFSVVLMLIFESPVFVQSTFCIGLLLMHCLGTTAVSLGVQWTLQYMRPSVCGMMGTLQLVIFMVYQYTFLKDIKPGLHNWVEILGAVICCLGILGGPLVDFITTD